MVHLIFFSIGFMVFTPPAFATFCDSHSIPKAHVKAKSTTDDKIRTFASKKAIAERADETLSKLIAAKSPVIAAWFAKRDVDSKTEDEIVKEWRDYFARNFILSKYPHGDAQVDKEIEILMNDLNKIFASKTFQKKLQNLFESSKKQSLSTIKTFPLSDEQKSQIAARVDSVKLYWMKDFKSSKFKQLPMEFLDWGIAYDPVANEINIGMNALSYPNDETYLAVFAHEIGHSFDSCRWGTYFKEEWPFQKIGDCLRTPESVGAKKRDDSKMDLLVKANKELAESMRKNPTCNKIGYPPLGLQSDQLPESFADWFSAEVMASMEGIQITSLRSDLCEQTALTNGSSYPTNELRLNAIYFSHPKLKDSRKDKLKLTHRYCEWGTQIQKTGSQ